MSEKLFANASGDLNSFEALRDYQERDYQRVVAVSENGSPEEREAESIRARQRFGGGNLRVHSRVPGMRKGVAGFKK